MKPLEQTVVPDSAASKRFEESLRLQSAALEAAANAIVITDQLGNILQVNAAFTSLTGYTAQEVLGKNPRLLKGGKQDEAFYRNLWQTISSGRVWSGELTNRRKDGSLYQEEMTITPLRDAGGASTHYIAIKQDISQRKRAEEALRQSEEQLRAMFDLASVGIAQADPRTGQWLRVNKKMCEITGYSSGELLALHVKDITHPEDRQTDWEAFERVVRGEASSYRLEKRYIRKDGSLAWVNVNMTIIRDRAGQPTRTVAALEDITERRRAEEALRLQSAALEAAANAIVITDQLGKVLQVNAAFTVLTGYTAQEVLGENLRLLKSGHHVEAFYRNLWQKISSGRVWSGELTNRRKDGSLYAEEMTITPLRDADGASTHYIAFKQDISERKRAEDELRWKTAFLEALVNSSLDGILVVDQERKTSLQNQRFTDLFKMPQHMADEASDENRLRWVTDMVKNPEPFVQKVLHLYAHPNETSHDEIELKDGTTMDRYSFPAIGQDGKYYGRIWTFRDITGRKRFEAGLFQSQKMETVGKLAGGVAHEFNSILTTIIGQSELLLGDLPAGSPLAKNAIEISKAAGRAATLTRQLLAYGRKQFLQPEILNLNRVIEGMEDTFRHLMGVDVETQILSAPGLRAVKADAGQIEQVIMNMLMNAREAMPNGGKLILETANVSFDLKSVGRYLELKPGDYVMLAITDTGTGMSEEVKARVFEPFFTTRGVGQGTGLGLSTCYGIIKQSGGHISVYSEPARGTTFKIYLPQVEPQATPAAPHVISQDLPRGTETILLVEDDSVLREMAETLLRRLGYTVLAAANGIEALRLKQQRDTGHVDLLFTDVVMPHMSGKELAERMQALYPHTRVLFTSAYTRNAIVQQGALNQDAALLLKPFTPAALASKVRELLDQPCAPKPDTAPATFNPAKNSGGVNTP